MAEAAAEMRFCRECNNMLYPREDRMQKKLMFACRNCEYKEYVENPCIYVNRIIKATATKLDIIPPDITEDPTLQRSTDAHCEKCGFNEAVFFQAEQSAKSESLALIFVCCQCSHKWVG
mmetsp:Transcript_13479/g.19809  ORF Transcript_13479/g.19809 Transcript_13479/m.19809 type:complete len:119 (+) Transcript_13479:88-444(+)